MAKWFKRVIGTVMCTGLLSASMAAAVELYISQPPTPMFSQPPTPMFSQPPTPMFAHTATH
jgi:hypothetical protein